MSIKTFKTFIKALEDLGIKVEELTLSEVEKSLKLYKVLNK